MAVALGLGSAAAFFLGHPAHAAVHRAGLVIQHASGRLVTRCVTFMESQLSGFELVQRSGIQYRAQAYGSMGEAICQLDGEPSPVPANCLGFGPYWMYEHRTATGWVQSQAGASGWTLRDGDLDGWRYTGGVAQTLPGLTLAQVCAAPVARPTPTLAAPTTAPSVTAATASPSPPASASPTVTAIVTGPASTPTARPSPSTSAAEPLGVLGGSLLILAGLAAWNLWRRAP